MRPCLINAILAIAALLVTQVTHARGHPGSGIVVDEQGEIFFTDTGDPGAKFPGFIWKIDAQGNLTCLHKTGAHWLTLDSKGSFARAEFKTWFDQGVTPWFQRIAISHGKAALIQTDGMPLAVHRDGNLYYASQNLHLTRLSPDGKVIPLFANLRQTTEKFKGIKGLAASPDGSLYVTCPSAVLKIKLNGTVSTLVHPMAVSDCDKDLPADIPEPYLRGLDVDAHGTVYAAATGCRCVVRVTPDGQVRTVLKAERPWSPTGVAVHGEDVYVLEYTGGKPNEWRPRVRKLGRDGKITTLATVSQKERASAELQVR